MPDKIQFKTKNTSYYNPFDLQAEGSNLFPDPYVGLGITYEDEGNNGGTCDNESDTEKRQVQSIDLNGKLTGCDFAALTLARTALKEKCFPIFGIADDPVTDVIIEGLTLLDSKTINSVNFGSSDYLGIYTLFY